MSRGLLVVPHNDDETLFAAFTIIKHRPHVCVVYDSYVQTARGFRWCSVMARRLETTRALEELARGYPFDLTFLAYSDLRDDEGPKICESLENVIRELKPDTIWAPAFEAGGHGQHNIVAGAINVASLGSVSARVERYTTYVRGQGKTRTAREVVPEYGEWIQRKLRALACYGSQISDPGLGNRDWFMGDLREYYL